MTVLRAAACSAAVLLAACAAPLYKVPEGSPTARLVVTNASGEVLPLYTFADAASCTGELALHPRAGVPMGDSFTVQIAAGAPFTLSAQGTSTEQRSFATSGGPCSAAGTFVPKPGHSYLAIFRAGGGSCSLQIGERVTDSSTVKYAAEPTFRVRPESDCR